MNTKLKNLNRYLIVVTTLVFMIGYWSCDTPKPCESKLLSGKVCNGVDTLHLKNDSITDGIKLLVRCNELILNTRVQNANEIRYYLKGLCFERKDSCPCSQFELWGNPSVEGIDVGVAVANAPKIDGVGLNEALMANILFSHELPTDANEKDTLISNSNLDINCLSENSPIIRVAIVDSGVDPNTNVSKNKLHTKGWHGYNLWDRCLESNYPLGLEYHLVRGVSEPMDSNGHGTAVNGVLVGASKPNFNMPLPLSFVNVDVMQGQNKTGNLYDALCGLYYALEQEPRVINISWGFRYLTEPLYMDMEAAIIKAFNDYFTDCNNRYPGGVIVVAGAGNDSIEINSFDKFYPACLARDHMNVVSVGSHKDSGVNDLSEFSNYADISSNYISLFAPGEMVITPYPKYLQATSSGVLPTGYARLSGTSFAAPYISRIVALIRVVHPYIDAGEVKIRLIEMTSPRTSILRPGIEYHKLEVSNVVSKICD
ncbi:MAG: S8/S53 family peptidase [Saprospiraceae bacterium]|nr:S8/S53 family peptidase [Saprospiraceae bacterium]